MKHTYAHVPFSNGAPVRWQSIANPTRHLYGRIVRRINPEFHWVQGYANAKPMGKPILMLTSRLERTTESLVGEPFAA